MDNLLKIGISKDILDYIEQKDGIDTVYDLAFNYEKVAKILDLFKNLGITNGNEILKENSCIFYEKYDQIEKSLQNNMDSIEIINKIPSYINEIVYSDCEEA